MPAYTNRQLLYLIGYTLLIFVNHIDKIGFDNSAINSKRPAFGDAGRFAFLINLNLLLIYQCLCQKKCCDTKKLNRILQDT